MTVVTSPRSASGLRCVEASAGTGKTHLLSTRAARLLVEDGVDVTNLLVVTFTVAASRELRSRVRERLAAVRAVLSDPAAAVPDDLAWCRPAEHHGALLERAERALAGFDAVTICTIHAFAQSALGARDLLVATGTRRQRAIADELTIAACGEPCTFLDETKRPLKVLDDTVRIALDNPDVLTVPDDHVAASVAVHDHARIVRRSVERFQRAGRRDGLRTYADLLTELDAAIADDAAPLLATLRARYRAALIDEFQDTDPLQWRILRRIFLDDPGHTLVVVGDPKQAIYGFRGADVATYLDARELAASQVPSGLDAESLTTNYRSDPPMLRVLNALFEGAAMDEDAAIRYRSVTAASATEPTSLTVGASRAPALSLRLFTGERSAAVQHRAIAEECAREAEVLLAHGTLHEGPTERPLCESDLVVLCEARTQFPLLREAFLRRGIRTTEAKTDDVLSSPAALDVAIALRAMSDPLYSAAVAAVAHTWLGTGFDRTEGVAAVRRAIAQWADVLERRGVAALARRLTDPQSTAGLLALPGGERLLTDVQHLFDVLAANAPRGSGAAQLLETLRALRVTERPGGEDDLRTRRIDTDAPTVRLMTIHGAKGLEFPVVLCPFIQTVRPPNPPTLWRDERSGSRLLDVGGGADWTDVALAAPDGTARQACAATAKAGENRRCLYVALTRAQHRVVAWWEYRGRPQERRRDELTALLLDRDDDGTLRQRTVSQRSGSGTEPFDLTGADALEQLHRDLAPLIADGLVELHAVGDGQRDEGATGQSSRHRDGPATAALGVAHLGRELSHRAQRCSFSSLVAAARDQATLDDALGDGGADDEPDAEGGPDAERSDPFGGMRGAAFGSAVHEALEAALSRRPTASFEAALAPSLDAALRRWGLEPSAVVLEGLLEASTAPIDGGPAIGDLALDDVATELRFELPVAAGVGVGEIAATLRREGGAEPFSDWAARIEGGPNVPLATSLVGSIDLVTSLGTGSRFVVIDYKTNVASALGYAEEGLRGEMGVADYPLQALLYLVALHRLLRWRLEHYDPDRHLGGAHYLFLRGMRHGSSSGIASWSPGARAVEAVSDLLAGAR